jgi:hypothetical protein
VFGCQIIHIRVQNFFVVSTLTGHLFAECPALSQTRYKILGHHILPLDFQWTPNNLQAMVNAITKRYPEEIPRAQGNNFSQPREPETP